MRNNARIFDIKYFSISYDKHRHIDYDNIPMNSVVTGDTTYGFKVNTLEINVPENFDPNKINLIIHEVLLALI